MMRDDSRRPADRLSNLAKAMQKSKVKEEKETLKLLEKISKKVMKESNTTLLSEMEKKCREMVAKGILELKQELLMTENLNSTRISHMEAKLSTLTSKLDDISAEITKSADKISKENLELQNKLKELIEAERLKRITMVKKAQEKNHDHFTSIENSIQAVKGEHMGFIQDIRDDLRLQTKEVVQLKERLDHIQSAYHNKVGVLAKGMFGGTSSSVNIHTDNADKVVDNMVQRLQRLEDFIQADNADNDPFTPNRSSIRTKDKGMNAVIRIRKMEENLVALQERIGENEDEIQHVKDSLLQNHHRESSSPGRGRSPMKASQNQLDQSFQYGESARDVKDLERKIKKLAENTTRACKSLSAGLTDVQQATLNLYQWSDKVHNAVEIIGEKVQLPSNLCPRARVPSRNES